MGLFPERKKTDLSRDLVLSEERCQAEGPNTEQSKTPVVLAQTEINLRDQEKVKEPKVARELRGSRPKSYCGFKIFQIPPMKISD